MAPVASAPHGPATDAAMSPSGPQTSTTPSKVSEYSSDSAADSPNNTEVASLNNKLIHAINRQTDLDDSLSDTRENLKLARDRIKDLESIEQDYLSMIKNRILVKWADVEQDSFRLKTTLAEERKQRAQVEQEKAAIEHELENLTTVLFEEANQMVANARRDAKKEKETLERRNEQLQNQLSDTEVLLVSQQDQLVELKQSMQEMVVEHKSVDASADLNGPLTPQYESQDPPSACSDLDQGSPIDTGPEHLQPLPPTQFSNLLTPILRTDIQAYEDFQNLFEISRKSATPSRVGSGNFGGLSGLGLSNLAKEQFQGSLRMLSNSSTSSLPGTNTQQSASSTPNLAPSRNPSTSSREQQPTPLSLRESAYFKRALSEDIEPTLRLDAAPGLSWLARRGALNSMCEGRLIVEPMPVSVIKLYQHPCALCGEQGRSPLQRRRHRFRINENDNAHRYPLCYYCLNRVRSTCDYMGFLRIIRDGHLKADTTAEEVAAWEESVRLRERMFWAKVGGGVIPAHSKAHQDNVASAFLARSADKEPSPEPHGQVEEGEEVPQSPLVMRNGDAEQSLEVHQHDDKAMASEPVAPADNVPQPEPVNGSTDAEPSNEQATNHQPPVEKAKVSSEGSSENPNPRTPVRTRLNSVARRAAMFEKPAADNSGLHKLQPPPKGNSKPFAAGRRDRGQ